MEKKFCQKCGHNVDIAKGDKYLIERFNKYGECPLCYTVIAEKKYENVPGGLTYFSSMGKGLGDLCYGEVVLRYYQEQNKNEKIIPLNRTPAPGKLESKNGEFKYFICDVRDSETDEIKNDVYENKIIRFSLTSEVIALAKMGHFSINRIPKIMPRESILKRIKPFGYVVIHSRNLAHSFQRNMTANMQNLIIAELNKFGIKAVIIGNDPIVAGELSFNNAIDLRRQLKIEETNFVMGLSIGVIGPDSGITQLAAVNHVPFIAWNYENTGRWMPRQIEGFQRCFLLRDYDERKILECITPMILWRKNQLKQVVKSQLLFSIHPN